MYKIIKRDVIICRWKNVKQFLISVRSKLVKNIINIIIVITNQNHVITLSSLKSWFVVWSALLDCGFSLFEYSYIFYVNNTNTKHCTLHQRKFAVRDIFSRNKRIYRVKLALKLNRILLKSGKTLNRYNFQDNNFLSTNRRSLEARNLSL